MVVANPLIPDFFIPFVSLDATSVMASSTAQYNHVYVIIRFKMSENVNRLSGSLFCHYGETGDAFLIGGAVEPNETLMACAIRHCRCLVDFVSNPANDYI